MAGAIAFVLGMLSPVFVHVVGEISAAELIIAPLLPILIVARRKELLKPTMRPLLILVAIWYAAQIITDIYRHTRTSDWVRGDANIIFFTMDLLALIALLGKSHQRFLIYVVGFGIGKIVAAKAHLGLGTQDPWKFGYAPGIALLTLVLCCYFYQRRNYAVAVLLLLIFCGVNVVLNFRSIVLFIFIAITMTIPIIPERIGRLHLLPPEGTKARLFAIAALAICAGGVAFGVVEFATKSGLLGQSQQVKNEKQAQSPGGLLLGGRPEILVSSRAVLESPIIGHGSWPKDPKYTEMLSDVRSRLGIKSDMQGDEETKAGVIPTHSAVMGAWVAAGVLGTFFWFYLISIAINAMVRLSIARSSLCTLYAYLLVLLVWNIFFSPFGGITRLLTSTQIVVLIDVIETPLPVFAKKWVSRFDGAWKRQMAWPPPTRL